MIEKFGVTAEEQLTCGCHIHVEVGSAEEGVAVLDRLRGWLPSLLALSANSPFWQGEDTGYASFRSQVHNRWPSAGPTELFVDPTGRSAPARRAVQTLIEHVRPALEDLGEYDVVHALTDALFGRGNGSTLQRDICRRGGSLADVVAEAVTRTAGI